MQLNVQHDIAGDYNPWIVEALVRKEWGEHEGGWGLQGGVMTIPFSLEHNGAAWSPENTISASALNSWLWEEFSVAGVEAEWWRETENGLRLGVLGGVGYGPDLFGRLLALRGWAMGDGVGGVNGDLPLPNGTRTDIFDERDDRPAAYTWITIGDAKERAALKFGYLDNMGDQGEAGVWHTRIGTVGATLRPHPSVDVVVQYLDGKARVREPANDSDLSAFYALVSYRYRDHRFSLRYDDFRVEDRRRRQSDQRARRRRDGRVFLPMGPAPPDRLRAHLARQPAPGRRAGRAFLGRLADQLSFPLLTKGQP